MTVNGSLQWTVDALMPDLSASEAAAVRSWLGEHGTGGGVVDQRALMRDHERPAYAPSRPDPEDPRAIRTVGVIGGGSAGYLTALALLARRPWLEISIVESPDIPVIGVGEATVPSFVLFLHHYLGIDASELYRRVRPTWKLGIRFDWGPDPQGFMAPFDWGNHTVGMLGSLATQGDINAFTLQSLFMRAGRVPVYRVGDGHVSLLNQLPFAYHLDNKPFVRFLAEVAGKRGIGHIDARIADVRLSAEDWVDHLVTDDGRRLEFDFYVDCTGFRSLLLGKALGTPFRSYASSLFTDSAVTGNLPHGGSLKPYTTATTMDAGWCWNIPTPDSDHLGYVYSSAALDADQAAAELARKNPGITEPEFIRFRTGRHTEAWRGNVMAVGNAYAFVEPLESSSLLMITMMSMMLAQGLPTSWSQPRSRAAFNTSIARKWDALRWFIAVHYRFNTRLDTPFWRDARANVDVSGIQPLLDAFSEGAPLQLRDLYTRGSVRATVRTFYDLQSYDCILLGQKTPARWLPMRERADRWHARKAAAEALVRQALPQAEALDACEKSPELLDDMLRDPESWAAPNKPIRLV